MKFPMRLNSIGATSLRRISFIYLPMLLSILLLLVLAQSFARLTWAAWPAPVAVPAPALKTAAAVDSAAPTQVASVSSDIANLHLFGLYQVQTQAVAVAPTAPAIAPETRLNLILRGVVASDDAADARAIIADPSGKQDHYAVNAQLPGGAVLKEIHTDRVILAHNNQNETLSLPKTDAAGGGAAPGFDPGLTGLPVAPQVDTSAEQYEQYIPEENFEDPNAVPPEYYEDPAAAEYNPEDTGAALRNYRDALSKDPQSLAGLGQAEPVREGDKFLGFRLQPGNDPALFGQFGLEPGDVITAVNGVTLDNPAKGFAVLQNLTTATQLQVEVNRNGEAKTLAFDVGE